MKRLFIIQMLICFSIGLIGQSDNSEKEELEKELEAILDSDQGVRLAFNQIHTDYQGKPELKQKIDSLNTLMLDTDAKNKQYIANLLDSKGWPSGLSQKSNMAIFFVIQHGGAKYMNKYADMVKKAYTDGNIYDGFYAVFVDRLEMYSGKPQTYGSQTLNIAGVTYVWPVKDVDNVELRRSKMGFPTMEVYLEGFKSMGEVVWDKEMTVEELRKKDGYKYSW